LIENAKQQTQQAAFQQFLAEIANFTATIRNVTAWPPLVDCRPHLSYLVASATTRFEASIDRSMPVICKY